MLKHMWMLLIFLTIGMHGMYHSDLLTVAAVERGNVLLQSDDGKQYIIEAAEAWRRGDKAECIISDHDLWIIEARYVRSR